MSDLPEITSAQKYRYEPGDSFILKFKGSQVSQEEAAEIKRRFTAALHLPEDTPIAILCEDWELLITGPFQPDTGAPVSSGGCLHCDEFFNDEHEPCICHGNCGNPDCRAS